MAEQRIHQRLLPLSGLQAGFRISSKEGQMKHTGLHFLETDFSAHDDQIGHHQDQIQVQNSPPEQNTNSQYLYVD